MSDDRPTVPVLKPVDKITADDLVEWPELEISESASGEEDAE